MKEFENEIADDVGSSIEDKLVTVTTAGTWVTVNRTDTKNIQLVLIKNPNKGDNANTATTVIYISTDGTTTRKFSLGRGEYCSLPGLILNGNLKIDSNVNGAKVEIKLWG